MTRNRLANGRDRVKFVTVWANASVDALVLCIHQDAAVVHDAVLRCHARIELHGGRTATDRHGLDFRCELDSLLNGVHIGLARARLLVPIKMARLREQDRAIVMPTPRVIAVDPAIALACSRRKRTGMSRIALGFVAVSSANNQLIGDTQACIVVERQGAIGTQQFIAMRTAKVGIVTAITLLSVPKAAPAIGHTRFRLGILLERLWTLARLFL